MVTEGTGVEVAVGVGLVAWVGAGGVICPRDGGGDGSIDGEGTEGLEGSTGDTAGSDDADAPAGVAVAGTDADVGSPRDPVVAAASTAAGASRTEPARAARLTARTTDRRTRRLDGDRRRNWFNREALADEAGLATRSEPL